MSDYNEAIDSIAREIIKENGLNDQNWHEAVDESVSGSWWLTYEANHETILDNTNNEPDAIDVTPQKTEGDDEKPTEKKEH